MTELNIIGYEGGETIVLGERSFTALGFSGRTVVRDAYLRRIFTRYGLDKVMPMDGDDGIAFYARLHQAVALAGCGVDLAAGYLVLQGSDEDAWSPELAKEFKGYIERCRGDEDIEQVLAIAVNVAYGFFERALRLLMSSRERSAQLAEAVAPHNAPLH